MKYQRKTEDTWQIWINYGQGFEHETTESSFKAAREQRKCYRDNGIHCPIRIIRKREKIEEPRMYFL